jgi:two-component system CitB family sensor kinase
VVLNGLRRRGGLTLAGQFLVLQLVVVALLLLIVGVISVRQSTSTFETERGAAMRTVAEDLAALPLVRATLRPDSDLAASDVRRRLAPTVVRGLRSGATDVLVVDLAGTVVAASDPALVGTRAELGDSDALDGAGWVGNVEHGDERAVAGHAPVYTSEGAVAVVVAEQAYPSLGERLTVAAPNLALYLGIGALLGVVGSFVIARFVRRGTRGLAPDEIARLADQREALLHSIREGVVAVGTDRRVTMMNDAARRSLDLAGEGAVDPVGRGVDDLGLDPHVVDLLTEGDTQDAVALVGERVLVFNRRSASSRGRGIGSVTTLRDRTELLSLQSQLSSNLSLTDTLRAQTHEFDNRLHTISGLVQLGEYDEVRTLVGDLTRHRSETGAYVAARIADPAVAALVVAKDAVAAERGVELVLDPGSRLEALPADASADVTTVVGNLVDNAVDACAASADALVELWLTEVDDRVHVRVRDTGPGVPDDLRSAIFVRGFSTKPEVLGGRGIGLPLVQLICAQRGGRVEVDRAEREGGAEFRVTLPLTPSGA